MPGDPILLVDDDPINLELARVILGSEGYQVLEAGNAATALAILAACSPRLVVTDLLMPGVDGFELARRIADEHGVPVVALTACAIDRTRQKALAAGCRAVVLKPIDASTLLDAVAPYCGGTPAARGDRNIS